MQDPKLLLLLDIVIEHYISKWDPIGSKFLHSLEDVEYAPSTLRKYLNVLEKSWLVYQPYNSSGRIPTVKGLSMYIEQQIHEDVKDIDAEEMDIKNARMDLKRLVEALGSVADGVVAGFLKNDEYFFLWINNLLKEDVHEDYKSVREIIKFIESKKIISLLDEKLMKRNQIYYSFFEGDDVVISCLYTKINIAGYDCVMTVLGPTRVNYRKNVAILQRVLQTLA